MRLTALAAMPVLACGLLQAQVVTATIAGTVTDAVTHQPIFPAQIMTASGPDAITAEDGSFTVHDVPPGDARFVVRSAGYRQIEATVPIPQGGFQRQDWELHPMGRLTVRVADADSGEALGLGVSLRPLTLYATGAATTPTRKKGETAFLNLEPGDYIVEVDSQDGVPAIAETGTEISTARPKAYDAASVSQAIHLEDGERRTLDIRVPARETFRAKVTLEIPPGREGEPVAIRLRDFQARTPVGSSVHPRTSLQLDKLLPGRYAVSAIVGKPADWEYGRVDFDITDRDVDQLKLSFLPMANLFGTVRMAEDNVALPPNLMARVMADDLWSMVTPPFEAARPVIPIEDGTFHVKALVPTDYAPTIRNLPAGYAVADVLYGNSSIGDGPFHLEGTGQLDFVITSKAGGISGKIGDTDEKPVSRHTLLLVPDSFSTRSSLLHIAESESDAHGAFAFRNLAPGKYRLMILKDQRLNAASITAQMPEGETVEVRPSETTAITLHPR